ncbi:citrate lyase subunit beta / citryl-CoA lyase [Brevibacterium pityocampae]
MSPADATHTGPTTDKATTQPADFDFAPAWLFVPADRPDRYAKAAERADIVIIDLEDAVAPADKAAARQSVTENLLDPARTVVRINPRDTAEFSADLELLATLPYTHVMLPKAESAADSAPLSDYHVVALIETARGAVNLSEIAAAPEVAGLMWGSEDLIADLGGGSSRLPSGSYRDVALHVRSQTLLTGRAHGKWVLDSIWADIHDLDGLAAEALDAVESGFAGKVSIHPKHIPVVRDAYRPTPEQLAWAKAVLELAETSAGAFSYEGKMIDAPLLKHAGHIVARDR